MKRLEDILKTVDYKCETDLSGVEVSGIAIDSRRIEKGFLFIAYAGLVQNGHDYIDQAVANGASHVMLEDPSYIKDSETVYILSEGLRQKVGFIASSFYGDPSREMKMVAITGTNGKTTTASLLYELFTGLSYKSGLISTIENKYDGKKIPAKLTTPDPVSLHAFLAEMKNAGVSHVFMEASSHALHQGRVNGVDYDLAVFTNMSHDHLDYHESFSEYIKAKKLLFDNLSENAKALINIDDVNGKVMVQNSKAEVFEYAIKRPAEFKCKIISNDINGLQLEIGQKEVFLRLVGRFNAYNALAAYATAVLLGEDETEVLVSLSSLPAAEGRFDVIGDPERDYKVVVDYAHTPDALEKVLDTLNEMKIESSRIITVVGCGGNRDKAKRPKMAKISVDKSDVCVFTSDNPRDEDPEDIIRDMLEGLSREEQDNCIKIIDRREAIKLATHLAKPKDIILVAGKGHEKYQEIKGQRFPFDDKEIIHALMRREDI